jgi:TIR domain
MHAFFISYRRSDSFAYAKAIAERLSAAFGEHTVFFDTDSIQAGRDFPQAISTTIQGSRALLAIIGPRWSGARDGDVQRLDQPDDWIRREIVTADEHGVLVVPVLVDGAAMPAEHELPEVLRPLCRRNAVEIRDSHFNNDVDALIGQLETTGLRRLGAGRKRAVSGLSVVVVVAFLITMALELQGSQSEFVKTLRAVSIGTLMVSSGLRLYLSLFHTEGKM